MDFLVPASCQPLPAAESAGLVGEGLGLRVSTLEGALAFFLGAPLGLGLVGDPALELGLPRAGALVLPTGWLEEGLGTAAESSRGLPLEGEASCFPLVILELRLGVWLIEHLTTS